MAIEHTALAAAGVLAVLAGISMWSGKHWSVYPTIALLVAGVFLLAKYPLIGAGVLFATLVGFELYGRRRGGENQESIKNTIGDSALTAVKIVVCCVIVVGVVRACGTVGDNEYCSRAHISGC